jgi:hypothetical protein
MREFGLDVAKKILVHHAIQLLEDANAVLCGIDLDLRFWVVWGTSAEKQQSTSALDPAALAAHLQDLELRKGSKPL